MIAPYKKTIVILNNLMLLKVVIISTALRSHSPSSAFSTKWPPSEVTR